MTTATRKPSMRKTVPPVSDSRYRMQCIYRITMAMISLVALVIVTFH